MKVFFKNFRAQPDSIVVGDQIKFIVTLQASEKGMVKLSIRDIDGLLNFDGQEVFEKQVYVEEGEQDLALNTKISLPEPADYNMFEMQLNALDVEVPPKPEKLNLHISDQRMAS
jgi:hypothetical protein